MKDELEEIAEEIPEMLEISKDYISLKFELPDNLVPVPCTVELEGYGFCPIMVWPEYRCPGYEHCPGAQMVFNGYIPYHRSIRCPDCKGELKNWIEGKCERCRDYQQVPLEEAYACDVCEYWRFDHCENCSCWHINLRNRPKKCEHKIPRDFVKNLR